MKKLFIAIFSIAYSSLSAQFYSGPESVEFDYTNNRWLIGNTGTGDILARDGNGELSVFAENFSGSGPYGLEIVDGFLFACADGGKIFVFDLEGNEVIESPINLQAEFLNGITHDNIGNLYITDFNAQNIYKMDATTYEFSIIADGSALSSTPNGIIFDEENNRCIIVTWASNAKILALDLNTNEVTTLVNSTSLGYIDGIAKNSSGTYFLSSWTENAISTIDSEFSTTPVEIITDLDSPADIFYNIVSDTLAIPNSGNNTVDFIGFDAASNVVEYKNKIARILIYPNPSIGKSTVSFVLPTASRVQYVVADLAGRIIQKSFPIYKTKGEHQFEIDNLENGFYTLCLFVNDQKNVSKFQIGK
jgi:Secretion system C-terminal sorting domain